MTPEQRKRIIARHRDALLRHGHSAKALYWSNTAIQEIRFQVLMEIGIQNGDRLLDVGCGFGDLFAYLKRQQIVTDYCGIDLSPDLITAGKNLYPQARFFCGDLFDLAPQPHTYDYVLLSGALNENMKDSGTYARRVIERMYQICHKGVALNLLDANNPWLANRNDLQSFMPDEMLAYCQSLGANCELRQDYLDNDFTVYLRKPQNQGLDLTA